MSILSLMPLMVTASGAYFLIRLRFFFLLHPKKCVNTALKNLKGDGAFSSFSLALAGTLGIGNIVGVAVGLSVGGAGAVFWLMLSSLFSAVIKYAEGTLCSDMGDGKGMLGVIEKTFGKLSRPLFIFYASLILLLSFVMGGALQSASIGGCAEECLGMRGGMTALIITVALFFSVLGNGEKIKKIINISIPLTTIIYILLCFFTILLNFSLIDDAVFSIFKSAFKSESAIGGVLGFLLSEKIREGYLRAILSNEAGAGTSSIAHSMNPSEDRSSVGVLGILEVFFDTVLLCGLTALSLLVSVDDFSGMSGIRIVLLGIGSVFGAVSEYLVFVCILAFAYSTVICWYYYGRFVVGLFLDKRGGVMFSLLFFASVFIGATVDGDILIGVTDTVLFLLSLISLSALIKNSDRVVALSEKSGLIRWGRDRASRSLPRRKYNREDLP